MWTLGAVAPSSTAPKLVGLSERGPFLTVKYSGLPTGRRLLVSEELSHTETQRLTSVFTFPTLPLRYDQRSASVQATQQGPVQARGWNVGGLPCCEHRQLSPEASRFRPGGPSGSSSESAETGVI